jgi:hypothetical protein
MIFDKIKKFFSLLLELWKKFSVALGWVNTRIIFTIIYVVIFGAYTLILRVVKIMKGKGVVSPTFWYEKKYQTPTVEFLERQF